MTEIEYRDQFEVLATLHKELLHTEGNKAFFYIDSIDELSEFDKALNLMKKDACMLLVASDGEFDDMGTENHVDEMSGSVYILLRKRTGSTNAQLYTSAKSILLDVLARTKSDLRTNPDPRKRFRISKIPYQKVGPMNSNWYGYVAGLTFNCPFGYSVNSGSWTDK